MSGEPMPQGELLARLLSSHREFLAFLRRHTGDAQLAEDILQDAFVRGLEKGHQLQDGESARAWFYRLLRNAVVDRHRREQTAARRLGELADALEQQRGEAAAEADRVVCSCITQLLDTLPEPQAEALRRIELDGVPVKDFAVEAGISESNAGVRVFRARRLLKDRVADACGTCAEHGCRDCSCKSP